MRITLKIKGRRLFEHLTKEMAAKNSIFPRKMFDQRIDWQLVALGDNLQVHDIANSEIGRSIVLIDTPDISIINHLKKLEQREFLFMQTSPAFPFGIAPIVLIFHAEAPSLQLVDLPQIVSDWMMEPLNISDLVSRLFTSLRRSRTTESETPSSILTLISDTRTLWFGKRKVELTPTELVMAEMFLRNFGSVISLEDIALLFKITGRSQDGRNIRVTMFQLRFKIETLSSNEFSLFNIYKEGYALRQRKNYPKGRPFSHFELNQEQAQYCAHVL